MVINSGPLKFSKLSSVMGMLTFLFESLYAIQNHLLQQEKLLVNCHRAAVTSFPSTASFGTVLSLVPARAHGPATEGVRWIDWMAPLFLTVCVYTGIRAKQSPPPLNIAFSLAPGPHCLVFPFFYALKQIQESSLITWLIFTQICVFLGSVGVLEIEVHAQLISFSG